MKVRRRSARVTSIADIAEERFRCDQIANLQPIRKPGQVGVVVNAPATAKYRNRVPADPGIPHPDDYAVRSGVNRSAFGRKDVLPFMQPPAIARSVPGVRYLPHPNAEQRHFNLRVGSNEQQRLEWR
jgi:hypothetical protein